MLVVNIWVGLLNWLWLKDFLNITFCGLVTFYEKGMLGIVKILIINMPIKNNKTFSPTYSITFIGFNSFKFNYIKV